MKIFLWVLQILLSLWNIIGGIYVANSYQMIARSRMLNALPKHFWIALGVIQVLLALGLILPGIFKTTPKLTPISALGLSIISLLGIVLYSSYDGFPGFLWGLIPAAILAYIAYGRSALLPLKSKKYDK